MLIVPSEKYNTIGYIEDGKQILCCDSKAYESHRCTNPNKLILNQVADNSMAYKRVVFTYVVSGAVLIS